MTIVRLRPFLRTHLDVLFVALNPPAQSNSNGHYFSGSGSRFFQLLHEGGLLTKAVPKSNADEIVFGTTAVNYLGKEFGVMDLVPDIVQTDSGQVRPGREHVNAFLEKVQGLEPRFVCIIHSKVRDALLRHACSVGPLRYGICGPVLPGSCASVVMNYFPNGNAISDGPKVRIFRELRDAL